MTNKPSKDLLERAFAAGVKLGSELDRKQAEPEKKVVHGIPPEEFERIRQETHKEALARYPELAAQLEWLHERLDLKRK